MCVRVYVRVYFILCCVCRRGSRATRLCTLGYLDAYLAGLSVIYLNGH